MTESEAIKICNTIGFATSFSNHQGIPLNTTKDELAEAMRIAINALEKQIPKKPILKNVESGSFVDYDDGQLEYKVTKWQDWVCPICGWFVGQRYNRSQNHSHDQRKCNYCNECGQKIDWSDEK